MEKAVYFTDVGALTAWSGPCDRFYFGHEFCQRRLPAAADLRTALAHARRAGRRFTFVTPFVTNAGLARVRAAFAVLRAEAAAEDGLEIVVNDWGVLRAARGELPGVPLALGRLLTKQKRGPRILRVTEKLPAAATAHFRKSNVDVPHVRAFLAAQGVVRVELDNLLQGMTRSGEMPGSLYTPYAYITTTRLCLVMGGDEGRKNLRSLGRCRQECRHYDVTLRHGDMPVPLLLKGNTQFFRRDELPANLEELNITRLVHEPALPV